MIVQAKLVVSNSGLREAGYVDVNGEKRDNDWQKHRAISIKRDRNTESQSQ